MKEGIEDTGKYLESMVTEVSRLEIIANRLMSEHSDYLLKQLIPKFTIGISRVKKTLKGSEGFTRSTSNRLKAVVVTEIMEALQANLLNFKRVVSVFNDDKENSFAKNVIKMEENMIGIVSSLNKAGLSLDERLFSPQKNNIPKELRR